MVCMIKIDCDQKVQCVHIKRWPAREFKEILSVQNSWFPGPW